MNFDDAVVAHSDWKRKLNSYMQKPDQSLKAAEVGAIDHCVLGKWIKGEGKAYSKSSELAKLAEEHTRFHKAAAEIISKADKGQNMSADVALGASSEFGKASTAVVLAIMEMKKHHVSK